MKWIVGLYLTHWGRVTHICIGNLTIIGSDNGLLPGQREAITWTNVGILLIGPLGTNFSEMWIEIHTFPFKKIHLKMPSGKWRPFCLGLNVLIMLEEIPSEILRCCWMRPPIEYSIACIVWRKIWFSATLTHLLRLYMNWPHSHEI